MHLTELAGAAGLFLVTVHRVGDLGDGLAVRDLRREELDVDLIVVVEVPLEDVDLLLAHAVDDGLLQFAGVLDAEGRVFGAGAVEGLAQLLLVFLVGSLDGAAILERREGDRIDDLVVARGVERLVRLDGLQLHGTAHVAGHQLGDALFLLAGHGVERGDALLGFARHVDHVLTLGDLARHHLEVGDVAQVLLEGGLVDEQRGLAVDIHFGSRAELGDELHQAADTHVFLRTDAEHGIGFALVKAHAQTLVHLFLGKFTFVEEFHHQILVAFGGFFHQFGVQVLGLAFEVGRNLALFERAVVILELEHLHLQDVDDAVEVHTRVDRELDHDRLAAECLVQAVEGVVPVGFLRVELVDGQNHRFLVLLGVAAVDLGAHLDALSGVDQHDSRFAHIEAQDGALDEVVGARSVDHIDLVVFILGIERRGIDGTLENLFDFRVVRNGVLAFDGTAAIDHFALEEHGFGQSGLAGTRASKQDDVSDLFSGVILHIDINVYIIVFVTNSLQM